MGFTQYGRRYSDMVKTWGHEMGSRVPHCVGTRMARQGGRSKGPDTYVPPFQILCQHRKIQMWKGLNSSPAALKMTIPLMMMAMIVTNIY